jgi:hypothetical protein
MRLSKRIGLVSGLLVAAALTGVQEARAANYPLELTNIKPVGPAPGGLDANNRIYAAYPGLAYNIRAAVIGGDLPYVFSLANAPTGMTINSTTGEISWPSPQATATPTITVRDAANVTRSATWTITVSPSRFVFLDAVNGRNAANNGCSSSCGTGTAANPWRTLRDLHLNGAPGGIAYFRSGTYSPRDITHEAVGDPWERVTFNEQFRPVIWLAYPGQTPLIDFGYAGSGYGPMIRLGGTSIYIDGFETTRSHLIAFQVGHTSGYGSTFRRLNMHDTGPGIDGSNSAFIMTLQTYPQLNYGMVIQDSTFCGVTGAGVTIKTYSLLKPLIENTTHCNAAVSLELKSDTVQYTVRGNLFRNLVAGGVAIGGNMHMVNNPTGGEIAFNNVLNPSGTAFNINQDGQASIIYAYRNTFVGRVVANHTSSTNGPFYLTANVIVNSDSGTPAGSHVVHNNVSAPSRIVLTNNLTGSPSNNIVDANGGLTTAYQQYVGQRGHPGGGGTPPVPGGTAPQAVTGVRIVTSQ